MFVNIFSYIISTHLVNIINICIDFLGMQLDLSTSGAENLIKQTNMIIGEWKMSERPGRSSSVIGPAGQPLTAENLPPRNTVRWVIRRKAEVVAAVRNGLIGLDEACERYRLSVEEFLNWERLVNAHGLRGLRVTRSQWYRDARRVQAASVVLSRQSAERHTSDR